jgi:pyruvate/2-oxoglutarate dehydrogenase complex dihydrolipoamide dehydrogenase (E3) component
MEEIIVIGGGPAGITAALRARELGAPVTLVERGRLGGTCTNDGCVPTRVLAKVARLMRETEHFPEYGLQIPKPELDIKKLMAATQSKVYKIHEKKQMLHRLKAAGVTVYTEVGEAAFIDSHTIILKDGRRLQADKFILCAGGHSRRIDFPGSDLAMTNKEIWEINKLPKSMAIIGAAATGCQLASILNAFGTKIYLFERAPRILRVEDQDVSGIVANSFEKRGIEIICGIGTIEKIVKEGEDLRLFYTKENQNHDILVEAAILSSGWLGNVSNMNLEAAGVKYERNYVIVDEHLRTTSSNIFAAGDITGRMMLVQSAGFEGRTAAENAVLGPGQRSEHRIIPHGGFTDPEYASVGITEEQASKNGEYLACKVPYADLDRAVIDGHPVGLCKLIISPETHRILGAHVVGEQALETIHVVAAGMTADMWVEQLSEMELAYPTFTSIIGLAARKAVRELGVMPLSPQWRAMDTPHAEWEHSESKLWL